MLLRAIAVSLSVHAAFFTFFTFKSESRREDPPRWVEVSQMTPSGQTPVPRRLRGRGKPKQGLSLADLGIRWKKENGIALPFSDGIESAGKSEGESGVGYGATGEGTGGDWVSPLKMTVVKNSIHEMLDSALSYPAEFLKEGIEGFVKAELWFTPLGIFVRDRSRFESASRFLRVLVLRTVMRAFSEPLSRTLTRGAALKIRCLFQFEATRRENPLHANLGETPKNAVVGSVLSFYRAGNLIGSWKLGPLAGYGIAPVVGVDPNWFVDQAEKIVSKKAPIDPLDKYRQDPEF